MARSSHSGMNWAGLGRKSFPAAAFHMSASDTFLPKVVSMASRTTASFTMVDVLGVSNFTFCSRSGREELSWGSYLAMLYSNPALVFPFGELLVHRVKDVVLRANYYFSGVLGPFSGIWYALSSVLTIPVSDKDARCRAGLSTWWRMYRSCDVYLRGFRNRFRRCSSTDPRVLA
ncbi:hypothetical protein B0H10DRAFT_2226195 [Mycena sp. CBHHK59/15]|nr:hypothetical protein B0H10DRAFT_2226195 [Mycena sp. CBHHK59/15]